MRKLALVSLSAFTIVFVSCAQIVALGQSNGAETKVRIANVKLNKEIETMSVISGEVWNEGNVPLAVTVTGTLLDTNGSALATGDQTLPVIVPGKGVPFNIAFPPTPKAVKQKVVVKSAQPIEGE